MIEERLRLVFSTLQEYEVRCLLMGGQACVVYGAAEFSKDIDFVILADLPNLKRVEAAMEKLNAEIIAVPHFDPVLLDMGLAVHFRCQAEGVEGLRVDLMTRLRGVDGFKELWERRFTITDGMDTEINIMAVEDLVMAKKTQRDKDWPMIQRLMEVRYFRAGENPSESEVSFLLRELRTPELLIDLVRHHSDSAAELVDARPLLDLARQAKRSALERALIDEMLGEKELDRQYWKPLRVKLEELRRSR